MKVSVILPVYNVEKYLVECLESAINQTLDDFEIIAVNDGSTDSSLNILEEYEKKYDFIKVITQENKGVSEARNAGLKKAKGEYIYFLDSDDYIELNTIEYCYNLAKKNDLDILTFDAKPFADKEYRGKMLIENYKRDHKLESRPINGIEFFNYSKEKRGYITPVWLHFYKREFLTKNKIEFYPGIIHEDELHTMQSYILASKIMYIPNQFFNRRIRNNSIMTTKACHKNAFGMYMVANEGYNFYVNKCKNISDETKMNLINHIKYFFSYALMYCDKIEDINVKNAFRLQIINKINECGNIYDKKFNLQINRPTIYYLIENSKLIVKDKIRKLYNKLKGGKK